MNIHEDLKAYIDGELSPERSEEVRLALLQDEDLRQEYEFMKILSVEIKRASKDVAVEGRPADVPIVGKKLSKWGLWQWSAAVTAGVVVLLGLGSLSPLGRGPGSSNDAASAVSAPIMAGESERKSMNQPPAVSGTVSQGAAPLAPAGANPPPDSFEKRSDAHNSVEPAAAGKAEHLSESNTGRKPLDAASASSGDRMKFSKEDAEIGHVSTPTPPSVPGSTSSSAKVPAWMHDIVHQGQMEIKVKSVRETVDEVTKNVASINGYVESSTQNLVGDKDGDKSENVAQLHVRVPVGAYDTFLSNLRRMGDVISENSTASDVTGQEIDYGAQAKTLDKEKADLTAELNRTRNSSSRIELRDRIQEIDHQIDGIHTAQTMLKDSVRYSTLDLTFRDKGGASTGAWFDDSVSGSTAVLGNVGTLLGRGAVFLFVLAPLWLPVAGIAWWISRRYKSKA